MCKIYTILQMSRCSHWFGQIRRFLELCNKLSYGRSHFSRKVLARLRHIEFLPHCMQCSRGLATRKLGRPSVKRDVDCDKTEERSVQIFIPYERSFSLVFWVGKWLVGATPSTWNFGSNGLRRSEIADFQPIFACSALAVTPSEKSSINTNRKSTTRFLMSLRWLSYVALIKLPPPWGLENAKRRPMYIWNRTSLKESLLQLLYVKTVSRKVVISLPEDTAHLYTVCTLPLEYKIISLAHHTHTQPSFPRSSPACMLVLSCTAVIDCFFV